MEPSRKPIILIVSTFAVLMLALAFREQYANSAPNQSHSSSSATNAVANSSTAIHWLTDLPSALAKAKETGRPIFIDFYADWCGPCKVLDSETFVDPRVLAASTNWLMVKIDVDQKQALSQYYNVQVLPTLLVLSPEGKELRRELGFIPAGPMLTLLQTSVASTNSARGEQKAPK